jgi:hypothetical protein
VPEEWNPFDSEDTRVHYDLSRWTFEQQAELASELAEGAIPHAWDGAELLVPEECEADVDALIEVVEIRLDIVDDEPEAVHEQLALEDGEPVTEYDLSEWPEADRRAVTESLIAGELPFRWEGEFGTVLAVATADESSVDELLDTIERGELVAEQVNDDDPAVDDADEDELLTTLTSFFLAADRLQRNPNNPDASTQLADTAASADAAHPPYGVERKVWERACVLAGEIAELVDDDDEVGVQDAAEELRDLLRPFV